MLTECTFIFRVSGTSQILGKFTKSKYISITHNGKISSTRFLLPKAYVDELDRNIPLSLYLSFLEGVIKITNNGVASCSIAG